MPKILPLLKQKRKEIYIELQILLPILFERIHRYLNPSILSRDLIQSENTRWALHVKPTLLAVELQVERLKEITDITMEEQEDENEMRCMWQCYTQPSAFDILLGRNK